jgi:hypothetical protein
LGDCWYCDPNATIMSEGTLDWGEWGLLSPGEEDTYSSQFYYDYGEPYYCDEWNPCYI